MERKAGTEYSSAMHVFTYGTLMFPEVWRAVVGRDYAAVRGTAAGYGIYRVGGAQFPGIIESAPKEVVRGVVYLDVAPESIERLDRFEDDFYERRTLSIECADKARLLADAYVVPAERREVLTNEVWQADEFAAAGHLEDFIQRFAGFSRAAEAD